MRSPLCGFLSTTPIARRILRLKLRNGLRIQCRVNEFIAFVETFVLEDYEVPGLDWQSVRTIVDVGANIGVATIWFAQRAPHAKIVAVEPTPMALSLLRSNVNANGLKARVGISPVALGRTSGIGYLHESESTVGTQVQSGPMPMATLGQQVMVTTLDQLTSDWDLEHIDLLKVDCEGAEYDVLLSANTAPLARIGAIVGEYHEVKNNNPQKLALHLESCGFEVQMRPHPREPTLGTFLARQRRVVSPRRNL
jgi:FkbM family methyltransferase